MHHHVTDIEAILGLLVVVAGFAWVAGKLRVPYPVLLVVAGLGIGFIPGLPRVGLRPEVVFLLFLPPLIYYPSMLTSWRDFRANLRPISLLAVGLVLFTTIVIALVAHHWIDGLIWPAAFALGAIISPPDAVAATAIMQRLRIPKRVITILEGESLLNDASALVALRFAIQATVVVGSFSLWKAGLQFLLVSAGGIVIGYLVGRAIAWVRPRLKDESVEGLLSLLTPFIAYLPAEWLGVSGVLAAVTSGIYIGRRLPRITSSQSRLRLYAVWETIVFLLNGLIFVLIGLQLPVVVQHLRESQYTLGTLIGYSALITVTAVVARIVWVFPATYLPRLISRKAGVSEPPAPIRAVMLVSWTGFRGIVSLAAALALPVDPPFPGRDLILFVTFGVILATLVLQGLTLPLVVRLLRLEPDDDDAAEEAFARREGAHAALARLEVLSITNEEASDAIVRIRVDYQDRLSRALERDNAPPNLDFTPCHSMVDVRREALAAEREMLIRIRDEGRIGDEAFRRVQQELDLEESRLGETAQFDGV